MPKEVFIFEIDFDFPSPKIVLQNFRVIHLRVGTDQIRGIAVKEPGLLRQAVAQRLHDQNFDVFAAGDFGADRHDGFDFECVFAIAGGSDDFPPLGIVLPELIRRR